MEAERVLNDLYKKINETGCEGRLPVAIFRVEKNILTYSGWKWRFVPNSGIYEIAVMAEKLQESVYQIYAEVFHQIVHILNAQSGITDTSNYGRYLNRHFQKKAEELGLKATKKEYVHGFDIIEVPKSLIEKINFPMFETNLKKAIEKQSVEIAPPNITEALYRCPICKQYANADSKAKLFCGYCNTEMIRIEQKKLVS